MRAPKRETRWSITAAGRAALAAADEHPSEPLSTARPRQRAEGVWELTARGHAVLDRIESVRSR